MTWSGTTPAVVVLLLVTVMVIPAGPQTANVKVIDALRARAGAIPIGSTVRVRLNGGERLTAVLSKVDQDAITVTTKTRVPSSRRIAFDEIETLVQVVGNDRASLLKTAAIWGAVGVAIAFVLTHMSYSD